MSKKVTIRYLIDVAIGSPEPGIVNFNALYTVLQAISEKLDIDDEQIEVNSSFCPVASNDSKSIVSSERLMNHQIYDIMQPSKTDNDVLLNKNSKENKRQHRSVSLQSRQTTDDRKVAFGQSNNKNDEEISSRHETKKSKNMDVRQQIDCLNERLNKIENFAVWSVDTEQSVECLRQIVQKLQDKIDSLEQSVLDLKDKRYGREEDISACRIKLEYDNLSIVTDALKKDLNALKESINVGGSKNMQIEKTPQKSPQNLEEIARLDTELIELKTNVCLFNEKLKSLEDIVVKTDKCSPIIALDLFQNEMSSLKAQLESSTVQIELQMLKELTDKLEEVVHSKIDKEEVNELLSEKADYSMLHGKVSVEIMDYKYRKFEKQLSEIAECIIINEEQAQKQIDNIKNLVGEECLKDILHEFKLKINKDIQRVSDGLKRLSEIKTDMDSAVTRLKDLTCLACDQDVVMKAVEVNKLSKFSDAYVSKSIGPSITFEVGKLREAGKIGVFNDSDMIFALEKKLRHSGGAHTVVTNKDRISRTRLHKSK